MGRNFFESQMNNSSKNSSKSPHPCASILRTQDSNDLRMVFEKYDSNGDGKISSSELGSMLQSLGHPASADEVESMMRAADLDGDGYISLEDFLSVPMEETDPGACMEDLRSAFAIFDQDRNGLIYAEELHRVLGGNGGECFIGRL